MRCGIASKCFHPGEDFLRSLVGDQEFAPLDIHVHETCFTAKSSGDQNRDAPDRACSRHIAGFAAHQKMSHPAHQPGADPTAGLSGSDRRFRTGEGFHKFQHPPPFPERQGFH